ncbi:MAG: nucleoside deaminase [Planctomycetes bacterium]|nr:nucleoside deaminase [Planctomycetota bacterium]
MGAAIASFEVRLPRWLAAGRRDAARRFATPDERMAFVLTLAERNVVEATGGPFAAAVFDRASGELVSVGVNLVVASGLSLAHAEVVALSLAERALGTFDLSSADVELVTSAEPCWMCLGALHWAGVRSIVCGARDADVRAIGFDEGHKPEDWAAEFARRGVAVRRDVGRDEALRVLARYRAAGGPIYNAGR